MVDIVALFQCLQPHVTATTVRQFSRIALAMLVMTGRVTMLGISRWTGTGGSYRTVQRFFATRFPVVMEKFLALRGCRSGLTERP